MILSHYCGDFHSFSQDAKGGAVRYIGQQNIVHRIYATPISIHTTASVTFEQAWQKIESITEPPMAINSVIGGSVMQGTSI